VARTLIAQISDTHIPGAGEASHPDAQPARNLTLALQHASRRCSGIIITGDCAAKAGTDAEYAAFAEVIKAATVPVWLVPGNHDDSAKMQRLFSLPNANGRCDYIVDVTGARIIVLDSTRLGREDGSLDAAQTDWLAAQLDTRTHQAPALIALHHPCIRVGGKAFDSIRLDEESLARLQATLQAATSRGARIHGIITGHAHMTCVGEFAGVRSFVCPSSAYEFGFIDGRFSYQIGEPQYMEYSWGDDGRDFLARVITVDDALWRTMP